MADNLQMNQGSGGKLLATDQVTINSETVDVPRIKTGFGVDGSYDGEASNTTPFPVNAYINSSTMQDGTTQLTPKFAYVNITADGDIVALVSSKKIRVLALSASELDQTADVVLSIETGTGTGAVKAILAGWDVQTIQGLPWCPVGWFETTSGEALYADVSGTTPDLNISVVYVEV